jgi:hypothetical protein
MGKAFVDVSPELIEGLLEFRKGMRLYGAEWLFSINALRLFVESDHIPELIEGQTPPRLDPDISYNDDPYVEWHKESDKLR